MKIRARIVLLNHLSDLQIETNINQTPDVEKLIRVRIAFVKYLVFNLKGDLDQEIDADQMYKTFLKEYESEN
jgi:hypothetical protein